MSKYMTARQLAERWGISVNTLKSWRTKGIGIHYVKLGGERSHAQYEIEDVEKYERDQKVTTQSEDAC